MTSLDLIGPVLKWPGGKRWLVPQLATHAPFSYQNYIEPFLGGAAVFFFMAPRRAILSDINPELVNFYKCMQIDSKRMLDLLKIHQQMHCKEYYYYIRGMKFDDRFDAAARMLYLNRTCWNGLYRVNLNGSFNVPKGTKDVFDYDFHRFTEIGDRLATAEIHCSDFEDIISLAKEGDFVFVDPPYTVKHNCNGFKKYNENLFKWDDQLRLSDSLARAVKNGAQILLTNADHESIRELYRSVANITPLVRKSVMASKAAFRGSFSELLIKIGYQT